MEQLVFEKPEKGSRKLIFDMGVLPTIASLLLLFSTVGASIFLTKNNNSNFFSTETSSNVAGQISVSKTLISHPSGTAAVGDTVIFQIIYSNIGADDIASFDLVDSFPSANLQHLSTTSIITNHKVLVNKDNHAEDKWAGYNYGVSPWLYSRVKPGDNSIAYIHFDLSAYSGSIAQIAALNIYLEKGEGEGNNLEIYGMTSPWDEGMLDDQLGESNWDEATATTSWNTPGGDFTSTQLGNIATPTKNNYLSSSLTIDTIQKWIDTPGQNHGIALLSSGNSNKWLEYRSSEAAVNKVPYLGLQVGKLPNVINSSSIVWNNITDLVAGTSDTIEVSFLAIDTCTLCINGAYGRALDLIGGTSKGFDTAGVIILPCSDTDVQLVSTDNICSVDSSGTITTTITSSLDYSYTWSDMLPEGQWTFESTMNDVSGNANHEQVVTGIPAYNVDAVQGSESFEFDGATKIQYSVLTQFMDKDISQRSISMWIKPDNLVDDMALYEEGNSVAGIGLRLRDGDVQAIVTEGTNNRFPISAAFPTDGNWHHVGLVYDGDILTLYIDGTSVTTVTTGLGTITFDIANDAYGGIGGNHTWHPFVREDYTAVQVFLMILASNVPAVEFYTGLMDNVSNYEIALTSNQMLDLALNFPNRTNLPLGDYTISIIDANGCIVEETVTIDSPPAIVIDTIIQDQSCFNISDGKIKVRITGGNPGYFYLWSTGSTIDSIENLSAGTYSLTITDSGGCVDSIELVVGSPAELILTIDSISNYNGFSISCFGENDGAIYTTPSGGISPYTFEWSVGTGTSEDTLGLLVGTYEVTVTDATGCSVVADTVLTEPTELIGGTDFVKYYGNGLNISCEDVTDGIAVAFSYDGVLTNPTGVAPYSYEWSNGQTEDTLRNVGAGKYYVTATDANGCTHLDSITFVNPPARTASITQNTSIECVGGNEASATANGVGGSGGDMYSWSNGATTQSIVSLNAGMYTVTIADENNCLAIDSILISDPDSIITTGILVNPGCTGIDGTISISMTGGSGPYTQTWSGGQTTTSISGLSAGTYTVSVSDNLGCLEVDSFILNADAVLAANISATDYSGFEISCYGASDGNVDVEITGGTGPYSYSWNSGQTTEDLVNVVAGSYIVTITDTGGGCTITLNITLDQPAELGANIADISSNDFGGFGVSCFGESDGFVFVSAFGGDGSHSYSWSNGGGTSGISNLSPGDYTVTVTDGRSCTWTSTYSITEPALLGLDTAYISMEDFNGFGVSCNGTSDGKIKVTPSGGEGTYSYAWSNGGGDVDSIFNLIPGVYTVTLTDANSCDTSLIFTITEPDVISISNTITNINCNSATTGEIELSVTGGTSIYTYAWNTGATTQDISSLAAGDYTVTVVDENACQLSETYTITEPDTISATAVISDVKCYGGNDGAIAQSISGGTSPYSFVWSNGATAEDISGLTEGTYTVSITDFYNCPIKVKSYTVGEPTDLTILETHANVTCYGGTNGSISITPSGGTPIYTYLWSNGATTTNLNSIVAGTYTLTVTDSNNCKDSISVTVGQAIEIIATPTIDSVLCNGQSNGSISLSVSGGNPGYSYIWNTSATASTINSLAAGIYTVTITDNSSCSIVNSYTVYEPAILNTTISKTDPLCYGETTGELTANPTGGTISYSYEWNTGATTQTINNLGVGTYTVTVTDKNTCSTSLSEVISTPTEMTASHSSADPLCNGDSNGSITVTPAGGVSPYTYQWNVVGSSNTLNNISAGSYTITITDLQSCDFIYNITLTDPNVLDVSSSLTDNLCFGDSNGSIDLTVTGGTQKYVYDWTDMDNEGMWTFEESMDDVSGNNHDPVNFSGNEDYSTDAIGGQYSFDFDGSSKIRYSVNSGGFLETSFQYMTISMWVKPDALTQKNTLFERGTSSRGLALRMDGSDVQGVVTLGSVQQLTSKIPFPVDGDWHHLALVYDSGDLILYLDGVAVSTINTPYNTISASPGNGGLGGTYGSDAFGNTGNRYYEGLMDNAFFHNIALTAFQIQDLANNDGDRTNLAQGTYTIEVTDGNGCQETISITINEPTALILTTSQTNVSCNGGSDGVARVIALGATSPYSYSWGGAETNDSLTGLSIGDYTVTVTDNNGCTNTESVTITEPSVLTASATAQDADCNGASDGQISLTVNGGVLNYSYVWSGGAGTSQNPTGLSANTYTVTITDSNGCTITASATVGEPAILSASNTITDISCNGEVDGSITTTVTGGTTNYSYSWSNGETTVTISNLGAGTYTVTATDANGCTSTAASSISEPSNIVIGSTITDVSCNGGDDGGVIALDVSGGTSGYTYLWSDMDVEAYYGFEQSMDDETVNNHDRMGGAGTEAYALDNSERNYSFDFDGSTKLEYEENNTFLNGTISTFSVSMWVKPDNFTGTQMLFDMGGVSAGFAIRLSGNEIQIGVNEFFTLYALQTPFPNDGAWHHVTMTFDNGDLVFFFDGVELGTYNSGVGSVFISNTQEGGFGGTFGTDAFGGAGDLFYEGLMDGVGYYNNALTAQQVTEVMANDGVRDLLSADTYTVTVIDANGCLATQSLSVTEPPALTISNTKNDIGCNGEVTGSIDITVGGGTPNYSYSWSNSATTQDLSSLSPGDYTVTVTDDNGCTITLTETISEPTSLSISTQRTINYNGSDISCAGNNDGAVEVIISGGSPNYNISWSSGQSTQQINSLGAGTYTVTVTDSNGCVGTSQITLSAPPSISLSVARTVDYTNQDVSCNGAADGALGTTVSGGSGTYTYSWSNGETTSGITNLDVGTYTVTVTDGFGCTVTGSDIVSEPTELTVSISLTGPGVSCPDAADGGINSSVNGGTTNYTYLWNGGQTTANLTNLGSGVYMLTVTDANSCTAADTLIITAPSDLSFTTSYSDLTDCGADDGAIGVNASGGTGVYEYSIDGTNWQASNEFYNLAPGTYNVYVRNSVGTCVKGPKTVVINVPEAPVINNTVLINPSTGVSTDGSIIVNASGNGVQLNYQLEGVTGWQASSVFSNLTEGIYTVKVKYYNQTCETSTIVELVAGGGVVGGSQKTDYCSGDINSGQLVEIYYIPFPENQVLESLIAFNYDACGYSEKVENPVQSYVSIGVVEEGTIIYYDHWEDGYEPNLGFPIQSTTEIWGDGDLSNGFAPGYGSNDLFQSSDNIILSESIDTTTAVRIATIDYDGSDKIASRGNIAMTRLAWASGTNTVLAGALEVYPIPFWGTNYEIPVGEDYLVNDLFEYTGLVVMASNDNTTVNIDADADGTPEIIITLNEGQSYLVNGGISIGGTVQTSADVQVHLITGDICAGAESRWFTLKPTEQWSDAYYTPVSTIGDDTYVHIYNPTGSTITINWETNAGSQAAFNVGSGLTVNTAIPDGSGAKFFSSGGEDFYAISTTTTYSDSRTYDWGFALIPEDQLSPQITLVSLAPGIDPTIGCTDISVISQAGWSLNYVDSEETVDEFAPATNAFDGDNSTYWHTEYGSSNPAHPHELQIDLGAEYNISGFRYKPRSNCSYNTNSYSNTANVAINSVGTGTYISDIVVVGIEDVTDINISILDIKHTWDGDLDITLTSPTGTIVQLFNNECGDVDDIFMGLDDEAGTGYGCPPTGGGTFRPFGNLSDFVGENMNGTWRLTVVDGFNGDGGFIDDWTLQIVSQNCIGGVQNGGIEDYEFYVSADGTNWGSSNVSGTFSNSTAEQEVTFSNEIGRYIKIIATSELNGNPWTSIAELNVLECTVSENSAPVWITAAYPTGSVSVGNINVCVDFNGDGGAQTDANGISYDSTFIFSHLDREKILDADGDQTGMRIWVCDGSDAIIAGAWGQDPSTASGGSPAIDLGVGLPNGIPFSTSKCVNLSKDYNLDGDFDECDEVIYTIIVENTGVLPLSVGSLNIIDTLPSGLTYLENTTISRINGVNDTIPDETMTASVFPLDETGISYNSIIQPGDSIILFFQATINDLTGNGTTITNQAYISNFQTQFIPEVTFPVDNPEDPLLTGVPADVTVECDSIPIAPLLDEPNCTFSNVDYPAAQTSGTTEMDGQAILGDGVTSSFDLIEGGITEQFRIADNLYPRDALQNIPCGASTKAIDFQIQQEESNGQYGSDSTSVFEIDFSQPVENLSFSILDLDESLFYVDAVEVRIFDGSNAEIDFDCGYFTINNNVDWLGGNEFQALDNTDGYTPVADTDDDGDVRFTFYNLLIKRVEITLKNNWNTSSTSTGTMASTFSAFMAANPGISHGVGIGQICYCIPGTNEGTIFIANDCAGLDTLVYSETRTDGSCDSEYSLTRSWTGTDHCGNDSTMTQVINVVDNTPPVLSGIPVDITVTPSTIPNAPPTDCSDGANLALGKTATQSSTHPAPFPANNMIDGDLNNFNHTMVTGDPQPWWQIDLGVIEDISVLDIYNRVGCCQSRTSNYYILVSETPFSSNDLSALLADPNVASYYQSTQAAFPTTINISRSGRYIRVQLTSTSDPMNIAEVMIYGSVANCITALDGCDSYPAITFAENTVPNTCNYIIERIWTATDECGNIQRDTQEIFVEAILSATDTITSDYNGRDISCNGGNNGAAHVIALGGVRPYNYAWSGGVSVDSFATGLSAGTYIVTITDDNGCTTLRNITLNDPPAIDLNAQATSGDVTYQISCNGASDGTAFAIATNGTGALTYEWSTGATTQAVGGLNVGTYTVTATDANLCQTTATVNIAQPDLLTINTSVVSEVSCVGSTDGSVLATPSGGVTPYSLLWNTNDTDPNLSGLGAGTYSITVTDGNGCTTSSSVILNSPTPISISFNIDNEISCEGGNDGQITASAVGGDGSYSYAWNNAASGATISGLSIGKYIVTVTDGNSCIEVDSISLTNPVALNALISVTSDFNGENLSCTGASDGRVKVFGSGGTSPYTYLWSDAGGTTIDSLSGVIAGTYTVTITDDNSCTTTASIEVENPTPVVADAGLDQNTCSNFDVKFGATGTGGVSNYTYLWSTGATTDSITINSLIDSTFYVTVTDDNGCTSLDSVAVIIIPCTEICDNGVDDDFDGLIDCDDPDCFSLAIAFVSSDYNGEDVSCAGASDGEATVRPTGGKSPYIYLWSDPLSQTDTTAIGLDAGTYTVTITDDNGCSTVASATLQDPDVLSLSVDSYSATVSCAGSTDGFIDVSVAGGATLTGTDYTYAWSMGGFTTQDISPPLGAGTYTVTVTDINNCQATTSVTIGEPIIVAANTTIASAYGASSENLSCANATDGLVVATATGGDGVYEYEWNTGSINDSLINVGAGTYTVTISDGNGCSSTAQATLVDPAVLTLGAAATAATDCSTPDGSITITASGSTNDLEYSIDNITWQASNIFSGIVSGTYPVYVRNNIQTCFAGPEYVTIDEPDAPIIFSAAAINPQTAGSSDGEILVEAEGASSPLEYRLVGVTPWQTSSYFQGLNSGNYIVEVRNQGENCPAQRPMALVTGGGIFGNSGASYCSDDFSNEQISETYYIPIPEDQALNSFEQLYTVSCGGSALPVGPIRSYVSISIVESDAMIYYDHWEDGFENDLGNIIQATTEIWGDGNLTNGVAPGYPTDILTAGDVIILDENVNTATRAAVIDFDGGDKIASRGNLAITRLAWATGSGTYLAGAVEIYPTVDWGRNFVLPIGEDYLVNGMFDYVGATIMAMEDNTSINIDADADGLAETSITLNEGQSYLVNGGINVGAMINADKNIQVHLLTGNICESYEGRWITLTPRDEWSDGYYNPVSTQIDTITPSGPLNDPTYVHLHNPNNNLIIVKWETDAGTQPNINVPAGSTVWVEVPEGTGTHFYTNGGKEFYAIATIGSDGETFMHDWGFGLIPQDQLTPQITMVGFAPGQDPTYTGPSTSNTAPVWLTGNYPTGSSYSGNITVCVDYNGNGGALLDINGVAYDASFSFSPLGQLKITDPDGDQTGMRIWVCDNSDAFVAGAWGQDPLVATGFGLEEIDLGTGLPNGIPFNTNECVDLTYELNNDGLFDLCEEVSYTISIQNSGALPFPANTILIIDTLAAELDYLDNSTIVYVNGIPIPWLDDSVPPAGSTFPLDEGGAYYPSVILPGDSIEIVFTASINAQPSGDGIISNPVFVFDGKKQTETNVDFYVENPTPPVLLNVPVDATVSCDSIPNPPALDTANCTLTTVPYPAAQPSGTTAMNGQNLSTSGVTTSYSIITGGIIEDFNMTNGRYPRSANQNMPCGASTKAISLSQEQEASNSVYSTGDSTVIRIEFSQEVEDLSFGLLDFDEGVWFVDGATVRVYDASNTEINYDCSQLTIGRNITMEGSNHFHALDNSDGYTDLADTDSVGDVRFNFYDIPVKRVEITLQNDWNSGSTSSGTSAISFADYFLVNSGVDHGIGISEMCFCVPGTIAEEGTIIPADDCRDKVTIAYSETTGIISCANNYTITRTWTATDGCGQSTIYNQQITVEDNDAPTISGVPVDVTVTPSTIPPLPIITVTDNCGVSPIITYSVDSIPAGCQYVIQRIWEAEDACSNIFRDTQNITVDVSLTSSASVISNYNMQQISCNGASDGEASVVVSGDYYPFNYSWSNSDADSILSSVAAGTYTVTVTNSTGCTTTTSVTISEPTLVQVNPKADTTMCAGEPFELTAAASGGNGTYLYSWNNGLGNGQSHTVNPLVTTIYTVTVTDLNSCTVTDQITVTIINCPENCTDGIDNDGDGLTDCDDPDCAPIANNATLNTCDNSNMTGSGTFFLHDANPTVSSESGVMISYHPTLVDAQNGTNILISPYTSVDAIVYSRVERVSTGCFATSEITLDVGAKCAENCNNGKDDDGDGLIDCDDPDCPCCKAFAPTLNGLNKKSP